ncbi:histone acetyltransferase KAT6B-like [Mytilus californianus]|uniref:histone acetyltransferase KAT6B-like n=1 Tax=Mytilus californianus TaxID=6549 RepID=UPI002247BB15|nr:histone acetyltransferase KAT6B-like [Mytilus californianus]
MPLAKYKSVIIECIDQLRQRKARPDAMRIAHLVARRHGLKTAETEAYLEQLVDSGDVLKVEFKGNTSYRVPSSSKSIKHGKKSLNSDATNKNILDALAALCGSGADGENKGASVKEIEKWFNTNSVEPRLTKQQLQVALDREADNLVILKLDNGYYKIISESGKEKQKKGGLKRKLSPKPVLKTEISYDETSLNRRGRPLSKRKKIRKSHGPDFETFYEQRANSPGTSLSCDYCLKSAREKDNGDLEKILLCKDCNAQAHPSCMGYNPVLAKRALRGPWQCIDCKICIVCEDAGDPDMMLVCDACDKGFHMNCHEPAVEKKPQGKWVCGNCVTEGTADVSVEIEDTQEEEQVAEGGGASCLPTPCESPASEEEEEERPKPPPKKMKKKLEIRPSAAPLAKYPDASRWKVVDVVGFFVKLGFKEQASSFQDQEIDGQSLLLLKRSDVLTGLNLKLGPALKIYQHVAKLQTVGIDLDDY